MNPTLRLPKERVLALDPADLQAYLLARGWKADRRASTPDAGVYHFPTDPAAEIVLPRDRGFVDYALRVGEVLQALAAVERRTAWEVLEDVLARRHGWHRTVAWRARGLLASRCEIVRKWGATVFVLCGSCEENETRPFFPGSCPLF